MRTTLIDAAAVALIVAVAAGVHFATGLDWPWAALIGAAAAMPLRLIVRRPAAPSG